MSAPYRTPAGDVEIPRTFRERLLWPGVKLARVALVGSVVALAVWGGVAYGTYLARRPAPPPEPERCTESVAVRSREDGRFECYQPSRLVVRDKGGELVEARCVCGLTGGGSQP